MKLWIRLVVDALKGHKIKRTKLFWWSPRRPLSTLIPELRFNRGVWARLSLLSPRVLMNFGDEFSPLAWEYATGRKADWSPISRADVVAIGSVLDLAILSGSDAQFWGSGARGDLMTENFRVIDRTRVLAVRGPLTAAKLGMKGLVLGDPGLLISEFVSNSDRRGTSSKLLFIPHFNTWKSHKGRAEISLARSEGFEIVAPTLHPLQIAKKIARADFVASSSLHGVVFAHSLGTPVQLIAPTGGEANFKYDDYFLSMDADTSSVQIEHCLRDRIWIHHGELLESASAGMRKRATALSDNLVAAVSRA